MNATELLTQLRTLIAGLAAPFNRLMRRHATLFLACGVVVLAASYGWSQYTQWRTKTIAFYTGPLGGSLVNPARQIADRIQKTSSAFGTQYRVTLVPTNGFEENRHRVSQDGGGAAIGFAHDGFGDSSNIAILLPLEYSYVHILCRSDWVDQLAGEDQVLVTFDRITPRLQPGRVYLGPAESGTRQAAEIILKSHELDPGKFVTSGIADWNEMRAALINKDIDLAFYSGPVGAEIIAKIARDLTCKMAGLDDRRAAILQDNSQMSPATFEAHSYGVRGFCPSQLQTLATRRVLICSRTMSDADAHALALCASEAIQDEIGPIIWKAGPPVIQRPEDRFSYILHPGAVLVRDEKPPSIWLGGWSVFLWTVVLWSVTEFVRMLNAFIQGPRTGVSVSSKDKRQASGYTALADDIDNAIADLDLGPDVLGPAEVAKWHERIRALRSRITQARQLSKVNDNEASSLLKGVRELNVELAIRKSTDGAFGTNASPVLATAGEVHLLDAPNVPSA